MISDGLTNVLSNLGTSASKSAAGQYLPSVISADELRASYQSSWVCRNAVDTPVDDATSKWRTWIGQPEQVYQVLDIESRISLRQRVAEAIKLSRLIGGSAIFIGTDRETLSAPMQPDEQIKFLNVFGADQITLDASAQNRLTTSDEQQLFRIDGVLVHGSRLAIFKGRYDSQNFFGASEIAAAFDTFRNADSVAANIAELVYEAKLDVYKIPDLLSQDESDLMKRLLLAQRGKSIVNAIVMDADESHEQKQINFSGLREILMASFQLVAGATGIPASKLLGMPVSGLSATGEHEIRNYYDSILMLQKNVIAPAIKTIDRLINNEAGTDIVYEWASLWEQTEREKAEVVKINADSLAVIANLQVFNDEQILTASKKLLGELMDE